MSLKSISVQRSSTDLGAHIESLHINIDDETQVDIAAHFDAAYAFIEAAQSSGTNKILVHCEMGMSRSSTMVIMYLMRTFKMTLREAFCWTKSCRPITNPNRGFLRCALSQFGFPPLFIVFDVFSLRQLAALEMKLFGRNSIEVSQFAERADAAWYRSASEAIKPPESWILMPPSRPRHPKRQDAGGV